MASKLADLRRSLVETRTKLREAQAALPVARARAERRAIDAAAEAAGATNGDREKALGSNETARNRALTIALADDQEYQAVLALVRGLETGIDGIERDIEIARDERRQYEWGVRERLVAALDGRGIAVEEPTNDDGGIFDDVATELGVQQTVTELPETATETTTDDSEPFPDNVFDVFGDFDDTATAPEGAEGEMEPATSEPPPLDPNDPIARMVSNIKPSPTQAPETRMDDEWMSRLADYEAAIAGCATTAELVKTWLEIEMDVVVDDQMRARLEKIHESRKKVLAKAKK